MAYRLLLPLSCLVALTACPAKEDDVPGGSSSSSSSEPASASDTGATEPGATSDIEATMGPDTTGPVDTSAGTEDSGDTDTGGDIATGGDSDTGGDTDTGGDSEEVAEECLLPSKTYEAYVVGPEGVWIDEPCVVTASQLAGDALELGFLCPMAGAVEFTVTGGPLPAVQVGETLDVFYRYESIEPIEFPHMGLLFLRSGDQLRYGAITGFLWMHGKYISEGLAPLTLGVEMGACPLVKNYEGDEPWGGDDWVCNFEALALVRLAFGDESLLQPEGTSGVLAAGADSYALDVRFARRGTMCIDYDLDRIAVAVALQSP